MRRNRRAPSRMRTATPRRAPRWGRLGPALLAAAWVTLCAPVPALAQEDDARPAFSLSTERIFEPDAETPPSISVTFRRLDHLDFRMYRVRDTAAFFAGLREAGVLGSPAYAVEQQLTPIERVAAWKARWRARITDFFRQQVSWQYRHARKAASAREEIVQRRTVKYTQFAQAPLLNPDQVVATWRELLPNTRESDFRTIPLDLKEPGVYVVEAVSGLARAYTIVVLSRLGLVTKTAPGQVLLFAVDRRAGTPREGCATSVIVNRQVVAWGATGADGVHLAELPRAEAEDLIALARCGDDTIVSNPGGYFLREASRTLKGYVYTDRPVYRPGHTVHLKAVLRWLDRGQPERFDRPQVEIVVSDPDDKVILRQPRAVDRFGSAFTSLSLPASAALGDYSITVNSEDSSATGGFAVEEYRKPEFEVGVSSPQRFYLQRSPATVTIRARYYFGQPVAHGKVAYATYLSSYYSPWRWLGSDGEDNGYSPGYFGDQDAQGEATLDENGEATVTVDLPESEYESDLSVRIEARVADSTGREVSGSTSVVATRGPFVLATQANRWLQAPGSEAQFKIRVVDYDGRPRSGTAVAVSLGRLRPDDYSSKPEVTQVASATVTTGADGLASWPVRLPQEPGRYRMRAEFSAGGRTMTSYAHVWVPGKGEGGFETEDRSVELVPDKATYAPGDTARFLVRGAERAAAILVTKEYDSTVWHAVHRPQPGETLDVPITDADVGDTWVNVTFVRDDDLFLAERRVKVPPVTRHLQVRVEPAQSVSRPREPGVFTVRTADAAGQPVSAQVSVGVVDEAVYGVKPDATPDGVAFFYRRSYSSVYTNYSRNYSFIGYSGSQQLQLTQRRRRPMSLADFKAERPQRPPVRKDFPDAIHWVADLVTDASGTATVQVAYPDSLTSWRVTARAVTEDTRLGTGVVRTTTTKDVIVRVAAPRFLTEGDTVTVPVVAHNYLDATKTFDVGLTASGVTAAAGTPTTTIRTEVASGGEHRSSWGFTAPQVGRATFTASARTDTDADAMEVSIPVLPYGLRRDAGTSGTLAGTAEQSVAVEVPDTSNPAARTVEISLAPSLAGAMLGALDFLTGYPYGCTEQTLSGFLPNLLVMRTLAQLQLAPGERAAIADRFAAAGLKRLYDYQHEDGGFGWWKTDDDHPFMTAYALYGYLEALDAGMNVDRYRIQRAMASVMKQYREYPRMVPELKAYLAWVIARARQKDLSPAGDVEAWDARAVADELWAARGAMGTHGRALLLMLLDAASDQRGATLAGELTAAAQTRGDLAWWTAARDPLLEDYADTSVEATALAVQALVSRDAANPVLERAVRWLLASRGTGSYWYSTKQTALALYGLLAFLKARNETPAAFGVDVLVNGEQVATRDFTAADFTAPSPVTLSAPARAGRNDVRIVKRGGGTLYWSAAARYYDVRESFEPQGTRRLAISRRYFSLAPVQVKGRIVYRETPFQGTAKPGDVILVRMTVAGADDWRYLVIEDPLPAGTEALANLGEYDLEKPEPWWTYGRGRREYRDDRVVQFQDRLPGGRTDFGYLLKVVTPGVFRAMPAQVLPMYVPGTAASTTTQMVTITDPGAAHAPSTEGGAR